MTSIIILAAGKGKRMDLGYNKMKLRFHDRPLFTYPVNRFKALGYEDIILVCNDDIMEKDITCVKGGLERMNSVYNGLKAAKGDYVMIHDGARPFINPDKIKEIEEALKTNDAVLLAHHVTDTIKIMENGKLKTLNRNLLIAAETPQAFKKSVILEAMEKAIKENFVPTDDISLIEKYTDIEVKVIFDEYQNIKLTTKEDIMYADYLFNKEVM